MDHAVALVQAYLQINGYFPVAEYPIIGSTGKHRFNCIRCLYATDCMSIHGINHPANTINRFRDSVLNMTARDSKKALEYLHEKFG